MTRAIELQDLLLAFKRRAKTIVSIVCLFTLCGGAVGIFIPPTYESEVDVLVNSSWGKEGETTSTIGEIDTSLRLIETYKQILKSDRMTNKVNEAMKGSYTKSVISKKVKIESGNGSQIITVIAQEETAELSALLANTFVATFKEEIKTLMNLDNLTILQEVASKTDTKKVKPIPLFYIALSFTISLVVCLAVILVQEVYFPNLDSESKVEGALDLPLLGSIFTLRKQFREIGQPDYLNTLFPRAANEDFRRLAAIIHHSVDKKGMKILMVTSTDQGDGKTFIGSNLAATLASDGKRTLFVDANLRNSTTRILFDLPERKGLTSVISGFYKLDEIIQHSKQENLSFISTGPLPTNPAQFLLSKNMASLMATLREKFDVVIVDTPALTVSDAVNILPAIDSCLFIVDSNRTSEKKALNCLQSLKKVDGNVLGVIVNHKGKYLKKMMRESIS
ncbi:polysaccharide biosynthesis tyrosine autokinase [Sporosarcina sp. FSL K6-1508]|uniref:polysaccharide biosynthesis tyrosine autokinase n=1 Tax=Sporosarcina sp. FSL K6-1508 TaxID=2921553 RepID=UPI0030FC51AB